MTDRMTVPEPRPDRTPLDATVDWLVRALAEMLEADAASVRREVPLWEYGVDSLVATTLLAEIDDELGVWVDPTDVPPGISLDELAAIVLQSAEEDDDVA